MFKPVVELKPIHRCVMAGFWRMPWGMLIILQDGSFCA
jgi:hypothetical protein